MSLIRFGRYGWLMLFSGRCWALRYSACRPCFCFYCFLLLGWLHCLWVFLRRQFAACGWRVPKYGERNTALPMRSRGCVVYGTVADFDNRFAVIVWWAREIWIPIAGHAAVFCRFRWAVCRAVRAVFLAVRAGRNRTNGAAGAAETAEKILKLVFGLG